MKRLFALIVLLGLVIGAVTGCSDNGGGGGSKDTNAPVTPPPTNAPAK